MLNDNNYVQKDDANLFHRHLCLVLSFGEEKEADDTLNTFVMREPMYFGRLSKSIPKQSNYSILCFVKHYASESRFITTSASAENGKVTYRK